MKRYLVCDDVTEQDFHKLEEIRARIPSLKVTCFVMGKDAGDYLKKNWIEVAVHGWSHSLPPECERDNQEEFIQAGLDALRMYLPKKFGFRAPGFQVTTATNPILKRLGFSYIAHQRRVQSFNGAFEQGEIINTHIYDHSLEKVKGGSFAFISEGFHNHTN